MRCQMNFSFLLSLFLFIKNLSIGWFLSGRLFIFVVVETLVAFVPAYVVQMFKLDFIDLICHLPAFLRFGLWWSFSAADKEFYFICLSPLLPPPPPPPPPHAPPPSDDTNQHFGGNSHNWYRCVHQHSLKDTFPRIVPYAWYLWRK